MAFRLIGNTTEPPARPVLFQIQGKFRGIPNGDIASVKIPPPRTSGKLSRSTLYKIFTGMLCFVFVIYCIILVVLIDHGHGSSKVNKRGKWGPTLVLSHQVLQDHIRKQAVEKRLQLEEDREDRRLQDSLSLLRPTNVSTTGTNDSFLAPKTDKNDADYVFNLEELDIHEMQPLERTPQHATIRNVEAPDSIQINKSEENEETKNITNTTDSK